MNTIKIRSARRADAEAIAALANILGQWILDCDSRTTARDVLRYAFEPKRWCDILVACDDRKIVGYALYRHFFEGFTGERRMFLSDLAVAPDARRSGVGETLMQAVARDALKLDCDVITWECSDRNQVAMSFYDKLDADRIDQVVTLAIDRNRIESLAG